MAELRRKTSKIVDHFPELRSGRSSLVVMDGEMKSLTSEFIEQVGTRYLGRVHKFTKNHFTYV